MKSRFLQSEQYFACFFGPISARTTQKLQLLQLLRFFLFPEFGPNNCNNCNFFVDFGRFRRKIPQKNRNNCNNCNFWSIFAVFGPKPARKKNRSKPNDCNNWLRKSIFAIRAIVAIFCSKTTTTTTTTTAAAAAAAAAATTTTTTTTAAAAAAAAATTTTTTTTATYYYILLHTRLRWFRMEGGSKRHLTFTNFRDCGSCSKVLEERSVPIAVWLAMGTSATENRRDLRLRFRCSQTSASLAFWAHTPTRVFPWHSFFFLDPENQKNSRRLWRVSEEKIQQRSRRRVQFSSSRFPCRKVPKPWQG